MELKLEQQTRPIRQIVQTMRTLEGEGFVVRRPFPTRTMDNFDPFLLLDHLGPVKYGPGKAVGAPDHPHRGFETVSYILDGEIEHKDSVGNKGLLKPGDVQWMTAGAGVIHSEMPSAEILQNGGRVHGFQLWVNLPARDKMIAPRYQDTPTAKIPTAETADGKVRVKIIAGEALGSQAVIDTRTPIMFLHFSIQPGGVINQPVPADFNIFAYVFGGEGIFGEEALAAKEGQAVFFEQSASDTGVKLAVPETATAPMEVLLIGGLPLGEPVARYGPFVMNTEAEIYQAILDYQNGKMGVIRN